MQQRRLWAMSSFGALIVTGACATTELTTGAAHPANPGAPSGTIPSTTALASSSDGMGGASPRAAQPAHDHAAETKMLYTCPMHPEIVRDAPGKCPICGMALVPKKDEK